MNTHLIVQDIIYILEKEGYISEAKLLIESEYGATGGEILNAVIQNLLKLKQDGKIYVLISQKAEQILVYAKEIGYLWQNAIASYMKEYNITSWSDYWNLFDKFTDSISLNNSSNIAEQIRDTQKYVNGLTDFNEFYSSIRSRKELKLSNDITIKFDKELDIVEVYHQQYKYTVEKQIFDSILKEFSQELEHREQQIISRKQDILEKKKRDEILYIGNHIHSIDIAYIDYMHEIKIMNAASTYSLYLERLRKLKEILNIGDIIINDTEIKKALFEKQLLSINIKMAYSEKPE